MTKILEKQEFKFKSPINRETSYGSQRLADDVESVITVQVGGDGSGWFDWDIDALDENVGGMLEFDEDNLTGYDGVFELPVELLDFLESKGYNVEEVR